MKSGVSKTGTSKIYIYIDIGKSFQSDNRIRFEHRFDIGEFFPFVCLVQQAKKKKLVYGIGEMRQPW